MAEFTHWITAVDQPANGEPGIAHGLLRALAESDSELADEARDAQRQLQGIWDMEGRFLRSCNVTSRLAAQPWTDPIIAETAMTHEIDLDWLTAGDNTLYIVAPVLDQQAIAPALGGPRRSGQPQGRRRPPRPQQRRLHPRYLHPRHARPTRRSRRGGCMASRSTKWTTGLNGASCPHPCCFPDYPVALPAGR